MVTRPAPEAPRAPLLRRANRTGAKSDGAGTNRNNGSAAGREGPAGVKSRTRVGGRCRSRRHVRQGSVVLQVVNLIGWGIPSFSADADRAYRMRPAFAVGIRSTGQESMIVSVRAPVRPAARVGSAAPAVVCSDPAYRCSSLLPKNGTRGRRSWSYLRAVSATGGVPRSRLQFALPLA